MYQAGELVVYGTTGVCRVEGIECPDMSGGNRDRRYYRLRPLHQDGVIYTPAEHSKVPMRPVISAQAAEALIDQIPAIRVEAVYAPTLQALAQHYQAVLRAGGCEGLLRLTMSIYRKQQAAKARNRRLGMVDERYWKQAELLLHGELAAALGIPIEAVPAYIARRASGAPAGTAGDAVPQ